VIEIISPLLSCTCLHPLAKVLTHCRGLHKTGTHECSGTALLLGLKPAVHGIYMLMKLCGVGHSVAVVGVLMP
jgi:hypothetical protein